MYISSIPRTRTYRKFCTRLLGNYGCRCHGDSVQKVCAEFSVCRGMWYTTYVSGLALLVAIYVCWHCIPQTFRAIPFGILCRGRNGKFKICEGGGSAKKHKCVGGSAEKNIWGSTLFFHSAPLRISNGIVLGWIPSRFCGLLAHNMSSNRSMVDMVERSIYVQQSPYKELWC